MKNNSDQRGDQRFIFEAAIWLENINISPGRYFKAEISNISRKGLYFESDQALSPGDKIYIGRNRSGYETKTSDNYTKVEIQRRKALKGSSFRFGYGAEFLVPDNPLVKSIDKTKIINQNSHITGERYKRERREHTRGRYRKEIVFSTKNRKYMGSITNISRGGTFITTKSKISLGQVILLDIREDKTCKALRLKGWVVRLSPNGVGVKFDRRFRRDRRKKIDRRRPERKRGRL